MLVTWSRNALIALKFVGTAWYAKEACHHRLQPSALFRDGRVHVTTQLFLDLLELGSHAVAPCFALELEGPAPGLAANEDEAQEREGLRLTQPALLSPCRRMAAELQQARLLPVQFEPKLLEPRSHRIPEALRIGFMFETCNDVVGVTHDDHFASGFSPPPLLSPEIEDVVQVDVCEQWRYYAAYNVAYFPLLRLSRSNFRCCAPVVVDRRGTQ